jgi:hypothetical protein
MSSKECFDPRRESKTACRHWFGDGLRPFQCGRKESFAEMDQPGGGEAQGGETGAGVVGHEAPVLGPAEQGVQVLAVEVVVVIGRPGQEIAAHQVLADLGEGQVAGEGQEALADIALVFPGFGLEAASGLFQVINHQGGEFPGGRRAPGARGRFDPLAVRLPGRAGRPLGFVPLAGVRLAPVFEAVAPALASDLP